MRLLNARTIAVEDFSSKPIPPYAILSHTWANEEVTFQDVEGQKASAKAGYAKIRASCEQTLRDNLDYIWVDTCCIDKTSSAELSEAINAMFRWYQDSTICYAFLADVPSDTGFDESSQFANSQWFTRGWTLQELLAPSNFDFYSKSWDYLGSKAGLAKAISSIARVDEKFLRGRPIREASIAARMSWAARRKTSREEDRSYSLLGLFDVHIPLLYGEGGRNAFFRLQEELIRKSDDQSIFAWHSVDETMAPVSWDSQVDNRNASVLADSPSDFWNCSNIVTCNPIQWALPYVLSNVGIQMKLPIIFEYEGKPPERRAYAIIWCRRQTDYMNVLCVPVLLQGDRCERASPALRLIDRNQARSRSFRRSLYLETQQDHHAVSRLSHLQGRRAFILILRSLPPGYRVDSVSQPELWESWSATSGRLTRWQAEKLEQNTPIIIKIKADGSVSSQMPTFRVILPAGSSASTSRHNLPMVTILGSNTPHYMRPHNAEPKTRVWRFVPLREQASMCSRYFGISVRLQIDKSFQNDIHLLDVKIGSCFQFPKMFFVCRKETLVEISILLGLCAHYLAFGLSLSIPTQTEIQMEPLQLSWVTHLENRKVDLIETSISGRPKHFFLTTFPLEFLILPSELSDWPKGLKSKVKACCLIFLFVWSPVKSLYYYGVIEDYTRRNAWFHYINSIWWLCLSMSIGSRVRQHSQRLVHRWAFPLFRLSIWLENAIEWLAQFNDTGRIIDPTLSYKI